MTKGNKNSKSGKRDRSESDDANINLQDMSGEGDPPINFNNNDMPNMAGIYLDTSAPLENPEAFGYAVMPGPPGTVIPPNAAAGYGQLPPPAQHAPAGQPQAQPQPPAPQPVPAQAVPVINAQAGNLGGAVQAPIAQPAAQQAVVQQAAVVAANNNIPAQVAERNCLQEHWKYLAGALGFGAITGTTIGLLYGFRNAIWPPEPTGVPTPTPKRPSSLQKIDIDSDFVSNGKIVTHVDIDLTDTKLQSAALHGFDAASFAFDKADENSKGNTRTTINGEYRLDKAKKTLSFYPLISYMGGKVELLFTVDNPDKTSSEKKLHGVVRITYPRKPTVFDQLVDHSHDVTKPVAVDVINGKFITTGLKGKAQKAVKGADDIDPATVTFTGFEVLDPLDTTTMPVYSNVNQTMKVPNQGTWTADKKGVVTFTPETGFAHTPYPATFQVGDKKGRPSNVARVLIDANTDTIIKQIEAFAKKPDATFWKAYENVLIKGNPPPSVPQWNEVNALSIVYTKMHIKKLDQTAAFNFIKQSAMFTPTALKNAYDDFMLGDFDAQGNQTRAPYDRQYLWDTYAVKIDDTLTGLAADKLGTRFVRLTFMSRILARYLKALN